MKMSQLSVVYQEKELFLSNEPELDWYINACYKIMFFSSIAFDENDNRYLVTWEILDYEALTPEKSYNFDNFCVYQHKVISDELVTL